MRSDISHLERFRHTKADKPMATKEGDPFGVFYIENAGTAFIIIFDNGSESGWEHASMRVKAPSGQERLANWSEMCWLKGLFWEDEECVAQIHPPKSEYINCHPYVLHLWKEVGKQFPRPPSLLVGPKS